MGLLRRKRARGTSLLPPLGGVPRSEGFGPCLSGYCGFGPLIPCPLPCTVGRACRDATLGCIRHAVVLAEVIQAFAAPENAVRMDEARDNACNDMGKMLQFVLPVATQIQQEVIKAYGFSCDGEDSCLASDACSGYPLPSSGAPPFPGDVG
ncbi:protein C10 isoform X2 [Myotis lucifugus]|uniref:protein C10 isoform X2 n=1 Tax=Myotis lucifugus TaxID=59463 RepID=UPI000CCBD9A6|nr:protein C10 isoform X2 [Myotis lucifugus]